MARPQRCQEEGFWSPLRIGSRIRRASVPLSLGVFDAEDQAPDPEPARMFAILPHRAGPPAQLPRPSDPQTLRPSDLDRPERQRAHVLDQDAVPCIDALRPGGRIRHLVTLDRLERRSAGQCARRYDSGGDPGPSGGSPADGGTCGRNGVRTDRPALLLGSLFLGSLFLGSLFLG